MIVTPNRADLATYLEMLFGYMEPGEENFAYAIALRGVGEKGTSGEGGFIEAQIVPPLQSQTQVDLILGHVQRWSAHKRASFIVPAAVAPSALSDNKATEDRILQFPTMCVDLDQGETEKALAHAVKYMGQASMVVHSGGITAEGHPKMHVYWRFSEPSSFVSRIAQARKQLALKLGGDAAFGRSTQVIRLPGSVYSKNGLERPCWIASQSSAEYESGENLQVIADMPAVEGIQLDTSKLPVTSQFYISAGGGLDFGAFKAAKGDLADDKPDIGKSLVSDIHEGGGPDGNRWGELSRVAGLYIKQARDGLIKMSDARGMSNAWMQLHMKPPYPPQKFETEFNKLVDVDARNHGPLIDGVVLPFARGGNPNKSPPDDMVEQQDGSFAAPLKLDDWDYSQWNDDQRPTRKFLVPGLIQMGKSVLLAAEGGAGKTFLLLDLAAKIAMHDASYLQSWCGMPLADDAGGTVAMVTTEDDEEEIKIRLSDILTKEQRARIKQRKTFKILPTINAGGAFALVERQRAQGPARVSERWKVVLDQLKTYDNLKLVIIDTLNTTLHGEENSATVINEYVQAAASVVCGEKKAALIITHHIRKPGANVKIYTADDMKAAIRGSSALIGAFRCVIGVWAAPDYKARLSQMGMQPKRGQLYNLSVVKANNPEMAYDMRALLRQPSGLLSDITEKEKVLVAGATNELSAWVVKAAEYAAEKMHPFSCKAMEKRPPNGRRHQLPPPLHALTERAIKTLVEKLIEDGRLVQCNPAGQKTYNYLDVPGGPLARADAAEDGTLYKVSGGKDFEPPDWLTAFAYHVAEQRIVATGKELDRTIKQGAKKPVEPRPASPFNPNRTEQQNVPPPLAAVASVNSEGPQAESAAVSPHHSGGACGAKSLMQFSPDCSNETKGL
jgi:hypothetical protein